MIEKFIRPQSRFLMKTIFKRNYDAFTDSGKSTTDKIILVGEIAVVALIIFL